MRLEGAVVAALLAIRQATDLIPADFCSPECPSCKTAVEAFDGEVTSCVADSSFITNCGHCQTCVLTYAIEDGGLGTQQASEDALINILNMCENTTVSSEIQAIQSQASRISLLGVWLASTSATTTSDGAAAAQGGPTATQTGDSTATETWTGTTSAPAKTSWDHSDNPSWTTMLSTAEWASYYYSHSSADASAQSAASVQAAKASQAISNITIPTSPSPTPSSSSTQLNETWVAGPVMGSVLGMSTVFLVIFFTRRKQKRDRRTKVIPLKEFSDDDSRLSQISTQGKAQLHGESLEPKELETCEIHELPALEPVGQELVTPRDATLRTEDWPLSPLPLSPLPLLFAMSELRDAREGVEESPRHETFYHR